MTVLRLAIALFVIFTLGSCTAEEVIPKKQTIVTVDSLVEEEFLGPITRVDSAHGYGYPFTFERARLLRRGKMFIPAAYIYIHLWPNHKDSTVAEAMRMAREARAEDSTKLGSWYFQQAIGTEMLMDHTIRPPDGKINQVEMKKRYEWSSELINALNVRGVR
jgi:hypothetical protein